MNKLIVMKIIGIVAAIVVVVGGVTVVVKMNRYSNSVVVKIAEKIKPVRVNPLIAQSNRVYWFVWDVYGGKHGWDDNLTPLQDCYYKGGYIPNADMKKELKKSCLKTAKAIMKYANQEGYFKDASLHDWLDQMFLKNIFEEHEYYAKRFDAVSPPPVLKKYKEDKGMHSEGLRVQS